MKINNIKGINETFAAVPSLEKVYITESGAHYFNEDHAKSSAGSEDVKDSKTGKITTKLKTVKYTALSKGAKELTETAPAA